MPRRLRSTPIQVPFPDHGIAIAVSRHAGDFTMPWFEHAFAKLIAVRAGSGLLELDGRPGQRIVSGDILWLPAHARHRIVDDRGAPLELLIVQIAPVCSTVPPLAMLGAMLAGLVRSGCVARAGAQTRRDVIALHAAYRRHDHFAAWIALLQIMRCLPACVAEQRSGGAALSMVAVQRWIIAHCTQTIRCADLAQLAGVSLRTFAAQFHYATGMTPARYVAQERLRLARRHQAAGMTVAESAYRAGFQDVSTYYRQEQRRRR